VNAKYLNMDSLIRRMSQTFFPLLQVMSLGSARPQEIGKEKGEYLQRNDSLWMSLWQFDCRDSGCFGDLTSIF